MLKIRESQKQVLEEAASRNFEGELIQHIKEFAPKHSEVIGDRGVREVVQTGIKRARQYGFTKRGPIRFYVELMFMFGSDFDTDFQLPWAAGVLKNDLIEDEMQRADILHEQMLEYVRQIAGEDNRFATEALNRLSKSQMENFKFAAGDFDTQAIFGLRDIYPQKCEYLGEDLLKELIRRGKESARKFSVTSEQGTALFVALMFALGHGFADDPLFPWVKTTMGDEKIGDPNQRAERLEKRMRTYLDQVIKYLEEHKQ